MKPIEYFYYQPLFARVFHTLVYCLQKELKNCRTVLDLGCGPSSPLQYCKSIKYRVGVEPFKPYLEESRKKKIHDKYLEKKIEDLNFKNKSFDAVLMLEVLEHLPKNTGREILKKAERWAKKKVIISTPNGYFPMGEVDQNPYQAHRSGWTVKEFQDLGYHCFGLAGVKFFYKAGNQIASLVAESGAASYANIRFRPQKLFYLINALFQIISFYFPRKAFGLLAIKEKNDL